MNRIVPDGFIKITAEIFIFSIPVVILADIEQRGDTVVLNAKLSKKAGVIVRLFHNGRIGILNIRISDVALLERVSVGTFVQTGKNTGPAGRANRGGYKGIPEINTFFGQFIHFGRLDDGVSCISQSIPPLVVGKDKNDVGR